MTLILESEKLTNNVQEGANLAPKDVFTHLPSLIEQSLDAHIKDINDKAVFL